MDTIEALDVDALLERPVRQTDDPMTATDVFRFDIHAARLTYLLNKKKQGQSAERFPSMPPDTIFADVPSDAELPAFLRRQAD